MPPMTCWTHWAGIRTTTEVRESLVAFAALVYQVEGRLPPLSRFEGIDPSDLPEWVTTFEPQVDLQSWGS